MDPNAQYSNNDRGTKKIFTSAQRYFSKCVDFPPYLLAVVLRLCSLKSFLPYLKKKKYGITYSLILLKLGM